MCLLAAEMKARSGSDPGELYAELSGRYGEPFYTAETLEVDDVLKLGVQSI